MFNDAMPFVDPSALPVHEPRPDERHSVRVLEPARAIVVDYPLRDSVAGIELR
jgi:hypothetical protein